MRFLRVLRIAVGTLIAAVTAVAVGKVLERRRATRRTNRLRHTATTDRNRVVRTDDCDGLPEPVQDYFGNVIDEGQQYVETVRLEQEGRLRLGGADSAWKPFTATQHVTTEPPGFFWDATVDLWPFVTFRIGDLYHSGKGRARVALFGLLPIGGDDANPELNEGELLRYLAEAVWYPTALLPSEGVVWEAIDERTATATLEYGGATATLTFHFTEDDTVSKVHAAQRPRRVADGYEPTPWTGHWHDYETRNGTKIPTAGEVVWHLADGDLQAWQGRVTDISYDEL